MILPIRTEPQILPSIAFNDDIPWMNIMLRLKPGTRSQSATAALRAVQPQVRAAAMPALPQPQFLSDAFELEAVANGTSSCASGSSGR